MDRVEHLIVGAGITGLATAAFLGGDDWAVLEADDAIGGYCKTVRRDGFTWDYSGHFFHFKHPDIEAYLRARLGTQRVLTVQKRSFIRYADRLVDFPFQKNIHQLPQDEFIECLHDVYFARRGGGAATGPAASFREMLYARFGRGICEKFLVPYNEKLYATDLSLLDTDAMGRFFPHADLDDIIRNMRTPDNASYNATFTYPEGGAIEYVKALASDLAPARIHLGERLVSVDVEGRVATTNRRQVSYRHLVCSAPFNRLLQATGTPHDPSVFTWNKVLVFNLGFDRAGPRDVHWIYYPDRALSFYRVGFYNNIFGDERLSLYVELGFPRDAVVDVEHARTRVLADLQAAGVITPQHALVAEHHVVMDPAYVHITRQSMAEVDRLRAWLRARGVHAAGRYGRWTYCSIEDNIVEARELARTLRGAS